MEETIVTLIQTLGFPIATAAVMIWYIGKIMNRNMDEAKEREANYQKILLEYGARMEQISDVLLKVNGNLADARVEHKEIMKYVDICDEAKRIKEEAEKN